MAAKQNVLAVSVFIAMVVVIYIAIKRYLTNLGKNERNTDVFTAAQGRQGSYKDYQYPAVYVKDTAAITDYIENGDSDNPPNWETIFDNKSIDGVCTTTKNLASCAGDFECNPTKVSSSTGELSGYEVTDVNGSTGSIECPSGPGAGVPIEEEVIYVWTDSNGNKCDGTYVKCGSSSDGKYKFKLEDPTNQTYTMTNFETKKPCRIGSGGLLACNTTTKKDDVKMFPNTDNPGTYKLVVKDKFCKLQDDNGILCDGTSKSSGTDFNFTPMEFQPTTGGYNIENKDGTQNLHIYSDTVKLNKVGKNNYFSMSADKGLVALTSHEYKDWWNTTKYNHWLVNTNTSGSSYRNVQNAKDSSNNSKFYLKNAGDNNLWKFKFNQTDQKNPWCRIDSGVLKCDQEKSTDADIFQVNKATTSGAPVIKPTLPLDKYVNIRNNEIDRDCHVNAAKYMICQDSNDGSDGYKFKFANYNGKAKLYNKHTNKWGKESFYGNILLNYDSSSAYNLSYAPLDSKHRNEWKLSLTSHGKKGLLQTVFQSKDNPIGDTFQITPV